MSRTYDVVVIGAGIVGAACAYELAREGMRTVVIERGKIGGGATAAGMGHIVIMDDSPAQFALTQYSQSLWHTFSPSLPANVEYDRCGTLWIAADEEEMNEVRRKHHLFISAHIPTDILDSQSLAEAEPNLRQPLLGALLVPSDALLNPVPAATYLIDRAQQLGTEIILGTTVVSAAKGAVRLDDGTAISAACMVHATGTGATSLLPHLPIRKRKGHLVATNHHPGFVRHQVVELGYLKSAHSLDNDSVAFNVQPRRSGRLLIGSSRQFGMEDSAVDPSILDRMLKRASEYMPALSNLPITHVWTGFRAATPDKLPLIGPTEDPTVFLATGHEGLGITTALATARLITDSLLRREPAIPIEPYLPARFATEPAPAQTRIPQETQ